MTDSHFWFVRQYTFKERHGLNEQLSCDDQFVNQSPYKMNDDPSEMAASLFEHALLKPLEARFHPTMGVSGPSVHVHALFLKFRCGMSYEMAEQEIRKRIPSRVFCHLRLTNDVPHSAALIKPNQRRGEVRLQQLNKRLVKHLVITRTIMLRKIRNDSTTLDAYQ